MAASQFTQMPRKLGAIIDEITEALGVGVGVSACAAIVYSVRALDAYSAAAEAYPP